MVSFTQKDAIKNAQNFEFKIQSYINAKQQLGTQPVVVLFYIDNKCDVLHVFAFDSLCLASASIFCMHVRELPTRRRKTKQ